MLNRLSDLYFFNIDISLDVCFPTIICFTDGHKILLEGNVSQNFDLGLSFYLMLQNGKPFVIFCNSIF